jgi:hypothetical protein
MEKKGLLLLVGLFVLVAAACATTGSTPSLTASGSPKDDHSASTAASGTPDNQYQALIGEWRGLYPNGLRATLIIHEIDIANAKVGCRFSGWGNDHAVTIYDRKFENVAIRADFIPGPSPKLKWVYDNQTEVGQWELILKNNVLEGTRTRKGMFGPPTIVHTITLEKYVKK